MIAVANQYQESSVADDDVLRSLLPDSFFDFVKEFWDVIIPEDPIWNWHIETLCNELQVAAERVFAGKPKEYDIIINIPPGSTKSTICSVMFQPWTWLKFPSARHITGSHSDALSLDLSNKSRRIVQSAKYQRLFPEIKLRDDQNTKSHWENTKGGARYATSVGSKITGKHAHFISIDDPIDPKGARSEAELKAANDWMSETLPSRKVDKRIALTTLIMQRLHQNDPTGAWLTKAASTKHKTKSSKKRIRHFCLPATTEYPIKPARLKRKYVDGMLDPIRLSEDVLEEAALEGNYVFAGQYGQQPIPAGGGMFKLDNLTYVDAPPAQLVRVGRYWDKAATEGGGAYSAGVKMGIDTKDRIVILHVKRGQWATNVRENIIKNTAHDDGYDCPIGVEEEGGSGGKDSIRFTKENLRGYKVRGFRPHGDKVARADAFSIEVNDGNVLIVRGDWNHDYTEELKYFPNSTFKDQIDASSGCYKMVRQGRVVGGIF